MIFRKRDLDRKHNVFIGNKKYLLSTVALGVEHYGGMWYESMVFAYDKNGEVNMRELYCERYKTREEAVDGHSELLARLEAGEKVWE